MGKIKVTDEVKHELERYWKFLLENEYTIKTATNYYRSLSRYLRWPARNEDCALKESIAGFLESRNTRALKTIEEYRNALRLYFKMLTGKMYPKRPPKEHDPEIEALMDRFYDYSVTIKRIQPRTAMRNAAVARNFLEHVKADDSCQLGAITAHNIREYVASRMAGLKDSSKGREISAIRNFFKFQEFEGIPVHQSIFRMQLSPAVWKNSAFPATIDKNVFSRLHEIPDSTTPSGKRGRCIMLCFTELALRCIEVAALTIDDFNWREGYVTIKNTKNHLDRTLPVSGRLRQAIIDYLKNSRPRTASRVLFVRFRRRCGEPMGVTQIRAVVINVYEKSGADIKSAGTHILRRTAATKIYNAGNSLKMTADILGHESLETTARYVKADIAGLRCVASPWPQTSPFQGEGKAGDRYGK
jgi:site-specific recombinase XerD